ncbi:HIT-like domain-containing protein [Dactylonectria estremocensis]|uniref:HIT-like domain-containing protein n=1 Tax=Dactylonectria estremocensis TaxID=1079267 RepID=A0A9P9FHA7_9HYPO|nr:HIT-like domain-containing protein [Dactylonectria estremocensis]
MSRLKVSSGLPDLVKSTFARARSEGDLQYYPTQAAIIQVNHIPFQLRFSPALANKPKPPPKDQTKPLKQFDPFANPAAALHVIDLSPSHFLVLNKFAVVPEHFILATTEFKPQTHVLEEDDLEATLACIQAYEAAEHAEGGPGLQDSNREKRDGLFAFFNCGEHSGASQAHRHIQLLPVARMKDGLPADGHWSVLADRLSTRSAPFTTFAEKIILGMSAKDLHAAYLRLYRQACQAVATHSGSTRAEEEAPSEGETRISYNMAMTKDTLVILPRLAEGSKIKGKGGQELGTLSLNGTVLAGTALVKTVAEWEALKNDPEGLLQVLKEIGLTDECAMGNSVRL